jgi:GTP cyclohydrolase I
MTSAFAQSPDKTQLADWLAQVTTDNTALQTIRESEDRIRRAYDELLSGYREDASSILNHIERVDDHKGLVCESNISFTSICGHHFLPFHGTIDVAYDPNGIITGLGKIPRLVQALAHRFQLQEFLVRDIAMTIRESIDPRGVYVRSRAIHLCMHSRGPREPAMETCCTYALGTFEELDRQSAADRQFMHK